MMILRRVCALAVVAALAGCESAPIPDVTHYRMPTQEKREPAGAPLFADPIVVDVFLADGLYSEQSILYQTTPSGPVKAYHYQLWNDPPIRLLQRRLIRRLRNEGVAPLVADRLPVSLNAIRVSGLIEHFERVKADEAWRVIVRVELRVDHGDQGLPILLESYEVTEPTDGESIQATVRAFARATDEINARFVADLRKVAARPARRDG
ncbi:MAG TPA: ABC-type transport auxiliary lipoprotein family protein [Candidatus Saccharimonadia bacterium]|nr:ABC-type transport auxiliary lipoprotein family protein [Candidatus Saccharimonadia bacterium]